MANAYILNNIIKAGNKTALDAELTKSGFTPVHGATITPPNIRTNSEIVVVLMPIDSTESALVIPSIKVFGLAGVRVIGIWATGSAGATFPANLITYGYSAICLTSPHFDDAVKGRRAFWENSDCSPREDQNIPRNRC